MTIKNARRSRKVRDNILAGKMVLRVLGSQSVGFRLGGENDAGTVKTFGQTFPKQIEAVGYGQDKFNKKAKKIVSK